MPRILTILLASILPIPIVIPLLAHAQNQSLTVYSSRQPFLLDPVLDEFSKLTGVPVNVRYAPQGLPERALAEGNASPVDVFITTDVAQLLHIVRSNLSQPLADSPVLNSIDQQWRDPNHHWFALTLRPRIIVASNDRYPNDLDETLSYESLAEPNPDHPICLRDGFHPYNLSLFSSYILKHGVDASRLWLNGLKNNLAQKPAGNDRAQVRNIHAGLCNLALINSYYLGVMLTNADNSQQQEFAASVRPILLPFQNGGTHVNISGMTLAKYSPQPDLAIQLMEFLADQYAQSLYASLNFEYPVHPDVPPSPLVASWGTLIPDTLPLQDVAQLRPVAARLVGETAFNQ